MDRTSQINPATLAAARHGLRPSLRHGLAPAFVVAGLALTVLWLGVVAWGVAMLVNAAI
jgi:hypothetical protein